MQYLLIVCYFCPLTDPLFEGSKWHSNTWPCQHLKILDTAKQPESSSRWVEILSNWYWYQWLITYKPQRVPQCSSHFKAFISMVFFTWWHYCFFLVNRPPIDFPTFYISTLLVTRKNSWGTGPGEPVVRVQSHKCGQMLKQTRHSACTEGISTNFSSQNSYPERVPFTF